MEDSLKQKTETQYYTWKKYRCAYEVYPAKNADKSNKIPLLLIHPIGVGLSRSFWDRFCQEWYSQGQENPIYNPDLLGCGESDKPDVAYHPIDWAKQLNHFLHTVVQKPVFVVVQGALFPVAIALIQEQTDPNYVQGLALSGPPAWKVMTDTPKPWKKRLAWNLFDSPLGNLFYRYARRRQFLESFSARQLFSDKENIDDQWLTMLQEGAKDPETRHAVFAFLSGFWRQDYTEAIEGIQQPTLVVFGEEASSISRSGKSETPNERLSEYQKHLPNSQGCKISGRNLPPYESTQEFVSIVADFVSFQ